MRRLRGLARISHGPSPIHAATLSPTPALFLSSHLCQAHSIHFLPTLSTAAPFCQGWQRRAFADQTSTVAVSLRAKVLTIANSLEPSVLELMRQACEAGVSDFEVWDPLLNRLTALCVSAGASQLFQRQVYEFAVPLGPDAWDCLLSGLRCSNLFRELEVPEGLLEPLSAAFCQLNLNPKRTKETEEGTERGGEELEHIRRLSRVVCVLKRRALVFGGRESPLVEEVTQRENLFKRRKRAITTGRYLEKMTDHLNVAFRNSLNTQVVRGEFVWTAGVIADLGMTDMTFKLCCRLLRKPEHVTGGLRLRGSDLAMLPSLLKRFKLSEPAIVRDSLSLALRLPLNFETADQLSSFLEGVSSLPFRERKQKSPFRDLLVAHTSRENISLMDDDDAALLSAAIGRLRMPPSSPELLPPEEWEGVVGRLRDRMWRAAERVLRDRDSISGSVGGEEREGGRQVDSEKKKDEEDEGKEGLSEEGGTLGSGEDVSFEVGEEEREFHLLRCRLFSASSRMSICDSVLIFPEFVSEEFSSSSPEDGESSPRGAEGESSLTALAVRLAPDIFSGVRVLMKSGQRPGDGELASVVSDLGALLNGLSPVDAEGNFGFEGVGGERKMAVSKQAVESWCAQIAGCLQALVVDSEMKGASLASLASLAASLEECTKLPPEFSAEVYACLGDGNGRFWEGEWGSVVGKEGEEAKESVASKDIGRKLSVCASLLSLSADLLSVRRGSAVSRRQREEILGGKEHAGISKLVGIVKRLTEEIVAGVVGLEKQELEVAGVDGTVLRSLGLVVGQVFRLGEELEKRGSEKSHLHSLCIEVGETLLEWFSENAILCSLSPSDMITGDGAGEHEGPSDSHAVAVRSMYKGGEIGAKKVSSSLEGHLLLTDFAESSDRQKEKRAVSVSVLGAWLKALLQSPYATAEQAQRVADALEARVAARVDSVRVPPEMAEIDSWQVQVMRQGRASGKLGEASEMGLLLGYAGRRPSRALILWEAALGRVEAVGEYGSTDDEKEKVRMRALQVLRKGAAACTTQQPATAFRRRSARGLAEYVGSRLLREEAALVIPTAGGVAERVGGSSGDDRGREEEEQKGSAAFEDRDVEGLQNASSSFRFASSAGASACEGQGESLKQYLKAGAGKPRGFEFATAKRLRRRVAA
uniref:Uncharacterized protein n=1 Tax=Chromera velia CCMP2878 TaxID=1169474 RepID=A0A0G4HAP9_9ALVE|eukprot:Cvel_25610.t1-p1 / transcript=Cvel_25610.t1 / gene=Cvel_25610 / organism=Chromera_velia_CCMP2878 / gene_product=hypothetical protein / transcript_product=hypothetical protein / location=Cvel_scaffold2924:13636-17097(-) / protein_length=1154 / sequence_SO=supercontig / SO=protein_coding / is_pseudo=false